jgi:hypothetical protein
MAELPELSKAQRGKVVRASKLPLARQFRG